MNQQITQMTTKTKEKNNAPVTSRTLNTTDKSKKKHILINCCYLCSLVSNGALFRVRKKKEFLVLQYVFVGWVYFVAIILHIPDFYGQINILSGLHMQDKVSTAVKLCCSKRNAYKFAHMKIQIHNETAQSAWMPTMVLFHICTTVCVFLSFSYQFSIWSHIFAHLHPECVLGLQPE